MSVCSRFSFELISFSLHTYILNWGDTSYTHVGCCALRYHHELLTFSRRLRWKFLSFFTEWLLTFFYIYNWWESWWLIESTRAEKSGHLLWTKISFWTLANFIIPNFSWFFKVENPCSTCVQSISPIQIFFSMYYINMSSIFEFMNSQCQNCKYIT